MGEKNTQKNKWDQYKANWTSDILANKGKTVELILWNSSLLFSKLTNDKLSGTRRYFFNEIDINEESLHAQLTHSIKDLGPKYNSALNLRIENIIRPFDALSRNSAFKEDFEGRIDKVLRKLYDTNERLHSIAELNEYSMSLDSSRTLLLHSYKQLDFTPQTDISIKYVMQIVRHACNITSNILRYCEGFEEQHKISNVVKMSVDSSSNNYHSTKQSKYGAECYNLRQLEDLLWEFCEYLESNIFDIANSKVIILNGKWGSGKSHLLADIALKRKEEGLFSILLLGSKFTDIPPRNFIQQTLCPQSTFEKYLSALNSLAQTRNERLFFIIDGINEGKGKYVWKDNINSLISEFSEYKWIGLIISYRSNYETILLPEGFKFPQVTHEGFHGIEDIAIRSFFNYYGILQTVPHLNPEFSNPLFLKIFCSAIQGLSFDRIPEGFEGLSAVFERFIYWINEKIGERLMYPAKSVNLVQKVIERLVKYYTNEDQYLMPYENANIEVDEVFAPYCSKKNNIDELIKEGLLVENEFFDTQTKKHIIGVTLSYERIIDHFKAQYLVNNMGIHELKREFERNGKLYSLIVDEDGHLNLYNYGLIASFAILLPEKYNIELHEAISIERNSYSFNYLYKITLESCLWRKAHTISESMWQYIGKHLEEYGSQENVDIFFSTLLQLSANESNFFNAHFLHSLLQPMSISQRDSTWSISIDRLYTNHRNDPVTRIIEWCWNKDIAKYDISDETALNLGITLGWFFTNSNRFIRDKATKGFVSLFSTKPHLLKSILVLFEKVNDPYVLERVIASIYGATTRINQNPNEQRVIAQYIYDKYFKSKKPPINILTRDYCKGIVEYVLSRKILFNCNKNFLYPPFKYPFPEIPDKNHLQKLILDYERTLSTRQSRRGFDLIKFSVLEHGDFSRYIIGTNFGYSSFSAFSIVEKKAFDKFRKVLVGEDREMFDKYVDIVELMSNEYRHKLMQGDLKDGLEQRFNHFNSVISEHFQATLSASKFALFRLGMEYIKHRFSKGMLNMPRFDLSKVQAYILMRVMEIGWGEEFFGDYDNKVDPKGRDARKKERIGKKYQWIAYYEILALLTDNHYYNKDVFDSKFSNTYRGCWQEHLRNIDPTFLLKSSIKPEDISIDYSKKYWWFNLDYNNWSEPTNTWLKHFDDMPDFRKLILTKFPTTDVEYYTIDSAYRWQQKTNVGESSTIRGYKDIWVDVKALIVTEKSKAELMKYSQKNMLWGREKVPLSESYYNTYKGEFYQAEQYNKSAFVHIDIGESTIPVINCSVQYNFESEYDCSTAKENILYPSKYLFELLSAEFGENDSCIYDENGEIIGFDTAAYLECPHQSLLLKKEKLDKELKKYGLEVVWHFWGEKEDIGPYIHNVYRMLFSGLIFFENDELKIYTNHKEQTIDE